MPNNFLVTGPPGSGKTTLIKKILEVLKSKNFRPGGVFCPEIRKKGRRKGFKIINIKTGESEILAHKDLKEGPRVGSYRVKVINVDEVCQKALKDAINEDDLIVVDEIAPMEVHSEKFKKLVLKALDVKKPLLGVIHLKSRSGFIGRVKNRDDTTIFNIGRGSTEGLFEEILDLIQKALS